MFALSFSAYVCVQVKSETEMLVVQEQGRWNRPPLRIQSLTAGRWKRRARPHRTLNITLPRLESSPNQNISYKSPFYHIKLKKWALKNSTVMLRKSSVVISISWNFGKSTKVENQMRSVYRFNVWFEFQWIPLNLINWDMWCVHGCEREVSFKNIML